MRLTKKSDFLGYVRNFDDPDIIRKATHKLGQLEDIEEEFEIDGIEDLRDRLTTYKYLANHEMSCVDVNAYNLMLEDLSKYHSIEDGLGIDLMTLFKALKANKIFVVDAYDIESKKTTRLNKMLFASLYSFDDDDCLDDFLKNKMVFRFDLFEQVDDSILPRIKVVRVEDYGATWSLDKGELL